MAILFERQIHIMYQPFAQGTKHRNAQGKTSSTVTDAMQQYRYYPYYS